MKSLIDKTHTSYIEFLRPPFSETPLQISAELGHLDFTETLLAQNPRLVAELDLHKCFPLHLASIEGYIEIVQALLHANDNACLICDKYGGQNWPFPLSIKQSSILPNFPN